MDAREWRVGSHYGLHFYAINADFDDDEPLGTALSPQIAEQVVSEHADAIHRRQEHHRYTAVIDLLTAERDDANVKAKRWSEKVEKLADENDKLAEKLNAAVTLHDHQVIENHRLRDDLEKLADKNDKLANENDRLREGLAKLDKKLAKSVCERDVVHDRIEDLFAENHHLRAELTKARCGGVPKYWPGVGDRVRHLRHGGTGTVTAPAASREPTVEVKNEYGQLCHWFVKSLEPLYDSKYAKGGWVNATDECAD